MTFEGDRSGPNGSVVFGVFANQLAEPLDENPRLDILEPGQLLQGGRAHAKGPGLVAHKRSKSVTISEETERLREIQHFVRPPLRRQTQAPLLDRGAEKQFIGNSARCRVQARRTRI